MKLSEIKAKQAIFKPVDPVYEETIEDFELIFKPRSDKEAYEKFQNRLRSGGLETEEQIAETFFDILESGKLGDYEFTLENLLEILTSEDYAFISGQLVEFFTDKSNFFTVPPPVEEKEEEKEEVFPPRTTKKKKA